MKTKMKVSVLCTPDKERAEAFINLDAIQMHEKNIKQKVDELMIALRDCDYYQAADIIDWMKYGMRVMHEHPQITALFSCADSITFPLNSFYFRKKYK